MRLYFADHTFSETAAEDNGSPYRWAAASPEIVSGFSGACYYSGRTLYRQLNGTTPIGLVLADVSGTAIELWSDQSAIDQCAPSDVNRTSELWNGMIHPLRRMRVTAFIWFQGEQNSFDPPLYRCRFPAMIRQWRDAFNDGDIPFYFALLGPIPAHFGWTDMRFAQLDALSLPFVNFANPLDLGDANNTAKGAFAGPVHFRNKLPLGIRFARRILRDIFDMNIVADGPSPSRIIVGQSPSVYVVTIIFDGADYNDGIHFVSATTCDRCCNQSGTPFVFILADQSQSPANFTVEYDERLRQFNMTLTAPMVTRSNSVSRLLWNVQAYPQCVVSNDANVPARPMNLSLTTQEYRWSAQ